MKTQGLMWHFIHPAGTWRPGSAAGSLTWPGYGSFGRGFISAGRADTREDTCFILCPDVPGTVNEPLLIRTPGAILRPWQKDDAPPLARYADNPRVTACMRDAFPSPYTIEDAHRFIAIATSPSPNLFLAIEVGGEAVGGIGIHPLEDVYRGTAEIGYWLAEPFWGKGIATDAVHALVPIAFERTRVGRIQAGIFSGNPASMRVLEKCGFTREAVHRNAITKNGVLMDEVMFVRFR
jgi:ribosomal-protein-alanine N-acetyltransferase